MELIGDKYEILQPLREGGMGAIYKVRHRLLDEIRVVKLMRPHASENSDLRKRFVREAKMAIRVRHPNIGQLYDFSIDENGSAVIVMEFIDGVTLQDVLASGPLPSLPFVIDVAVQTLRALSCLHINGIVHRDVSSDNVMLTRNFDGRPLVKVIDLGVAKDPRADATATLSGTFVGKARYAAPEQFRGTGDASSKPATDLYSFGVLLYELLTGRLPVDGSSFAELAAGHLFQDPVPFVTSDPGSRIPDELREAVLLALDKNPAKRFASAEQFAERLDAFGAGSRSDPLEFEQLMSRARAFEASRAPARAPAAVPSEGWQESASRASRTLETRGAHAETICDALLEPFLNSESLESIELLEGLRRSTAVIEPKPRTEAQDREEEEEEEAEVEIVPPVVRRRKVTRAAAPSSARYYAVGLAVALVIVAVVGFGLWKTLEVTDPLDGQTVAVLALTEDTPGAVTTKLNRVVGLIALLPDDDERRAELDRQRERLTNLLELHNYVERLETLLADARDSAGDPVKVSRAAADGENLWIMLREYRRQFAGDDPAALRIEDRGRDLLGRLGESTDSERLLRLADQP